MNISEYYKPMYIEGMEKDEDCRVYWMDDERKKDTLKQNRPIGIAECIGLNSCQHCDYVAFSKEAIIFIEVKDLRKKKEKFCEKSMQKIWDILPVDSTEYRTAKEEVTNELFEQDAVRMSLCKMYGSMFILSYVARECTDMCALLYARKKYMFWLVVPKEEERHAKYFGSLRTELRNKLGGLSKKHINFTGIELYTADMAKDKLKDIVVK